MMANHRTLALTPFDPTRTVVHDLYITYGDQLLSQPITNENTSFVFEFFYKIQKYNIVLLLALISSAVNFGKYRSIKA